MFRSSIGALLVLLTGDLFLVWEGASVLAANSNQTDSAKVNLRRIIGSPRKLELKSLNLGAQASRLQTCEQNLWRRLAGGTPALPAQRNH
jgi:hypothetical protein